MSELLKPIETTEDSSEWDTEESIGIHGVVPKYRSVIFEVVNGGEALSVITITQVLDPRLVEIDILHAGIEHMGM
jgi:hypothetical protein